MEKTRSKIAAQANLPETRGKRLRRLIILVALISVGVHLLAGIGAGVWVIARYLNPPKPQFVVKKEVKMNAEDRQHQLQMDSAASLRPKAVYDNRIQSLRPTKLALPELPRVPMENLTPIDTDALVTDQVDGIGKYGNGSGTGAGNGNGAGGFFGGKGAAGSGLLAGNFYDLKKEAEGKDSSMSKAVEMSGDAIVVDPRIGAIYVDICNRLSRSTSTDSVLGKYYKAPDTLFLPQIAIPNMNANSAPRAFNVADKVQPRYWLAVYKGRATAPETGNYRFIGNADDVLLVKVNNRLVLDASIQNTSRLHGKEGAVFRGEKGKAYDIEVIIGEAPGGSFHAWLQIQKDNDKPYWFRMSDKPVEYAPPGPKDKINGPIWWPAAKKTEMPGLGL